jgi:hypothetical protein
MDQAESRDELGRFRKGGGGGNPAGRPPKVREARALLEANAPALVQKAIDMAMSGDAATMRLVVERLIAVPKTLTYLSDRIDAPEVVTAADLPAALIAIVRGVVAGSIPLDTLAPLTTLLVGAHEATEVREVARRLAALEAFVHEHRRLPGNEP